jgi:uncharacterized protein (TIGR00299 family) protein
MRIAYLDCFSGISGDMFLGALVDAGVSADLLRQTVAALDVGATLEVSTVARNGIRATKVDVIVAGERDLPREVYQKKQLASDVASYVSTKRTRDTHSHEHAQERPWAGAPAPHHPHGGSLSDIRQIIARAPISERAKARATAMFEALGGVEAAIHQKEIEQIHFHEVGSADAIVDMVCAAVGSEALQVDEWNCSPLNVGGGTVECAHGTFPIPAPATLELLKARGAPVYSSGIEAELVTPTGAAIVSVLVNRFAAFPAMKLVASGYGAGYRELPNQPNVLRLTIGEVSATATAASDVITVLEANVDDLNPQVFGYVTDRLLSAGALDVFTTPVQMKKNRPGMLLTVMCPPAMADGLARLIFRETTTLGVRLREERRQVLERRHFMVETPWGAVRMKLASLNGTVANCAPEYEDCRRIAEQQQVPLKTVMQEAVRLYLDSIASPTLAPERRREGGTPAPEPERNHE